MRNGIVETIANWRGLYIFRDRKSWNELIDFLSSRIDDLANRGLISPRYFLFCGAERGDHLAMFLKIPSNCDHSILKDLREKIDSFLVSNPSERDVPPYTPGLDLFLPFPYDLTRLASPYDEDLHCLRALDNDSGTILFHFQKYILESALKIESFFEENQLWFQLKCQYLLNIALFVNTNTSVNVYSDILTDFIDLGQSNDLMEDLEKSFALFQADLIQYFFEESLRSDPLRNKINKTINPDSQVFSFSSKSLRNLFLLLSATCDPDRDITVWYFMWRLMRLKQEKSEYTNKNLAP